MERKFVTYNYNRDNVRSGILHIGVGNFHRAHQAFYTNELLEDPDQQKWGICGLNLLPEDESTVKALQRQQNIYTVTVFGRNGNNQDSVYSIGSLVELIWAIENPEAALKKFADKNIKIITCTITEGGYNLNKSTGEFILDNDKIIHDLNNPTSPKTVFGYIAQGLRLRMKNSAGPITLLSCDNMQSNGDTAKHAFTTFISEQDKNLAAWVEENMTFPNSMVDRITPITTDNDLKRLNRENKTKDEVPVFCEDFIQWVIEDNFIAGRPAWERVGVEFTDDVSAFENMKLSLLNASHTVLSYPSFLSGYRKVDDAVNDQRFERLIRNFMDIDITPYLSAPEHTDLNHYKTTLIERFGNRSVSDQISRLCADGISKYPVYVMPNLIKMINNKADITRLAFSIASYRHYLKYRVDDNGVNFRINEPWLTKQDSHLIAGDNPIDFLHLSAFSSTDLTKADHFVNKYLQLVRELESRTAIATLESIISQKKY